MNQLKPIEQNGQRVLTTAQLAESFGTESKNINDNFKNNLERYSIGKHYFSLEGDQLKDFKASTQISGNLKFAPIIYLWTEKGAWLHAKSLNTDQAWESYEMLVDDYYSIKRQSIDTSLLSPQMQMFKHMFDGIARMELEQVETKRQLENVQSAVTTIKDTIIQRDDDWRKSIRHMFNKTVIATPERDFPTLRNESYRILEERAHCDLSRRLRFLLERLTESGATKTKLNETSKLDVIESDPKLKEIYSNIVKELYIRFAS